MNRIFRHLCLLLAVVLLLNGCVIGYSKYPKEQLSEPFPAKQYDQQLYYYVSGSSLLGGYLSLRDSFSLNSPFKNVEERENVPDQGLYVKADIQSLPPSIAAVVFVYLSYSTLTILPCWSTKDGSIVHYSVYQDGKLQKTYDYEIRRKGAAWIGLLPFAWANLITASEDEVFEATAKQFFIDSKKYLAKRG